MIDYLILFDCADVETSWSLVQQQRTATANPCLCYTSHKPQNCTLLYGCEKHTQKYVYICVCVCVCVCIGVGGVWWQEEALLMSGDVLCVEWACITPSGNPQLAAPRNSLPGIWLVTDVFWSVYALNWAHAIGVGGTMTLVLCCNNKTFNILLYYLVFLCLCLSLCYFAIDVYREICSISGSC